MIALHLTYKRCVWLYSSAAMTTLHLICNSYNMGYPPVCGDNPRPFASGLSAVLVDSHSITVMYQLHQYRPCTARDVAC